MENFSKPGGVLGDHEHYSHIMRKTSWIIKNINIIIYKITTFVKNFAIFFETYTTFHLIIKNPSTWMWKNLSSLILTYNVSIEVGYKTEQRP